MTVWDQLPIASGGAETMQRVLEQKQIILINATSALAKLLESHGFVITAVQDDTRQIENAVWFVKPTLIFYLVERIDFDGFNPLRHIPHLFWPRTVVVSRVLNEQDILDILERHQKAWRSRTLKRTRKWM